jgi:hypothetical protein
VLKTVTYINYGGEQLSKETHGSRDYVQGQCPSGNDR